MRISLLARDALASAARLGVYSVWRAHVEFTCAGAYSEAKRLLEQAAVSKDQPDLLVLELTLPGGPGAQLLRLAKADERTSHIPVIACGYHDQLFSRAAAARLGAVAYAPVGDTAAGLSAAIATWLSNRAQLLAL